MHTAIDLHGHFGPFLALGVRMGLVGLRELGVKKGDTRLHATVVLKYVAPISCILDGVQTTTKCTVGNTRLTWKESERIGATFQLSDSRRRVTVWVNPEVLEELKHKLARKPSDKATRQLGWDIASRTDAELFLSGKESGNSYTQESEHPLRDLDIAKDRLRKSDNALVVAKHGQVLFETSASGIRGLLTALERIGKDMKNSAVADRIVGEAAAQLCAYSHVREVYAVTLSQCGKNVLENNHINHEYENLVPHILNMKKTDLCPFEKIVAGSKTPKEAYERLKEGAMTVSR